MIKLLRQYWFNIAFAVAIVIGVLVAHWSFTNVVESGSPYMIVDKNSPSDYSPVGYEPVEMTGISIEQGEKIMVSCKVPESYTPYLHYPQNWGTNVLNPDTWQGQSVKYVLFGMLGIVICLLIWRIIMIIKRRKQLMEG